MHLFWLSYEVCIWQIKMDIFFFSSKDTKIVQRYIFKYFYYMNLNVDFGISVDTFDESNK